MNEFSYWMHTEMNKPGWNSDEFLRRTGLDFATLEPYLDERADPDIFTVVQIAKAFGSPPETIYRVLGLTPREIDPQISELVHTFQNANQETKDMILHLVRALSQFKD